MDGKRRWFGWIAIGLGAVALVVALLGRGVGPQISAAGRPGAFVQQQQPQPQAGPDTRRQQGQQQAGKPGAGAQGGVAGPGGEARRGGRRPGGGFGMGGWLHLPFRLIGGSFQWIMLALLIGLGVWMLRGRNTAAASISGRAEPAPAPAQAPLSPTGEAYIEEPSESE